MALDRKPRVGDWVSWPGDQPHQITEVKDDGIAWMRAPGGDATCFIYYFRRDQTFNNQASFCAAPKAKAS